MSLNDQIISFLSDVRNGTREIDSTDAQNGVQAIDPLREELEKIFDDLDAQYEAGTFSLSAIVETVFNIARRRYFAVCDFLQASSCRKR